MSKKTLIYIGSPGSTVFESQVIGLLKDIESFHLFEKIILLAGVKTESQWEKLVLLNQNLKMNIVRFKQYPNYNFYRIFQQKELESKLKNILLEDSVVHLRGESLTGLIRNIVKKNNFKNVKLITDIRGASYEETKLYKNFKPGIFQLKLYQHHRNLKLIGKNSDYVSCVSEKLSQYVYEKSKIEKSKLFVNHCFASKNFKYSLEIRKKYRRKLNLKEDDILFVFVTGANRKWQNTDDVVRNISKMGYKILNLSRNIINIKNVINLFVDFNEVGNYLNAADIGFIWRNNDVVNNVASPIKFSEYICCGLPVIANKGVNLINSYIELSNYGMSIDRFEDISHKGVKELVALNRNEISENAAKQFSSSVISKEYISIYKEMLNLHQTNS